jgi:DNA-binding NtrC family response regulator
LVAHHWPGNIRELRNAVENMILFDSDKVLGIDDLPFGLDEIDISKVENESATIVTDAELTDELAISHFVGKKLADVEKQLILATLVACGDNRKLAARQLGMGERTLYRKIKEL